MPLPPDPFGRTPVAGPLPWVPACMGGWCTHRDRCAQHVQPSTVHRQGQVAERLCRRGDEQPLALRVMPDDAQAVLT